MAENYEIVKTDKEKYVNYKVYVRMNNETWFVLRRYKEFRALYKELKKSFPEAVLKIPPKKIIGNFSQKVIQQRVTGLNELVAQILWIPDVMSESCTKEFFNIQRFEGVPDFDPVDENMREPSDPGSDDTKAVENTFIHGKKTRPEDFEFRKVIGKGTYGKVFLAHHKETQMHYAVKVLIKSKFKSDKLKFHLMSERNVLLNNLKHSFLVSLHYAFQSPAKLYFVLDYVNGGELFYHLQKEGPFSEDRAKFYTAEIACALGYLHSRNILYRDLKPENLLLDRDGHIVITDFGLAKDKMDQQPGEATKTFCGTPEYLAPEILLRNPYSYPVDWWCLGCALYELLFGVPPFYHKDPVVMYDAIIRLQVNFNLRNIKLTEKAQNFLVKILNKNPTERLGTQNGLIDLENHEFFQSLDFTKLQAKEIEPPFKPTVENESDYSQVDPGFINMPLSPSTQNGNISVTITPDNAGGFLGFSYVRPIDALN